MPETYVIVNPSRVVTLLSAESSESVDSVLPDEELLPPEDEPPLLPEELLSEDPLSEDESLLSVVSPDDVPSSSVSSVEVSSVSDVPSLSEVSVIPFCVLSAVFVSFPIVFTAAAAPPTAAAARSNAVIIAIVFIFLYLPEVLMFVDVARTSVSSYRKERPQVVTPV